MERAVYRLNRYGCLHPDPQAKKRVVALLIVSHFDERPSHDAIYDMFIDFKGVVDANRKPYPLAIWKKYPASPCDLPAPMKELAWDATDPPVSVEVPGLKDIVKNHFPMRGNSKLLKGSKKDRRSSDEENVWGMLRTMLQGRREPALHIDDRGGRCGLRMFHPYCDDGDHDHDRRLGGRIVIRGDAATMSREHGQRGAEQDRDRCVEVPGGDSYQVRGRDFGDGVLCGASRKALPAPATAAEAEDGAATSRMDSAPAPAGSASAARDKDTEDVKEADLSATEKAALAALTERDRKKADAKKADAKKVAAKKAAVDKPAVAKRPAAAEKAGKLTYPVNVVTKSSACPKLGPTGGAAAPSDYRGGRIYCSIPKKGFRVLRDATNAYTERFVKWHSGKPSTAEWMKAMSLIDEFRKAAK